MKLDVNAGAGRRRADVLLRTFLVLSLAIVAAACRRPGVADRSPKDQPPGPSGVTIAAAEGAFCGEHGVPEAVCTKCNPSLIPAFQAKGDWCEEHGLPESSCPACKPESGGRPSMDETVDGAPADGTKVLFKTRETARLAGIQVVKAVGRASGSDVVVTASIVYDAAKVAEVNARSAGVVRGILADIGARVRAGSPLAIIESAGVGADQSRLQAGRSRVRVAEANHARMKALFDQGIAAEQDALLAGQELDAARADLSAAVSALGVVGSVADGSSRYTLTAPIAGVVTRRQATIGRLVDTEKVLFEIVDTSRMWAEIDIPETVVAGVAVGQPVTVTVEGLGERTFTGTLSYVSPQVDAHTRTAKGRVELRNPEGLLRGNMFASARVARAGSGTAVVVPRGSVQRAGSVHLVFVRLADDAFEARRVQLGPGDGEVIEVTGRIAPGDEVATVGSFLLKTETLKGSIGAGCCEVEERK